MKVNKSTGSWLDKKSLVTGDIIKIVSEAEDVPSNLGDGSGTQLVAKVLVKRTSKEAQNFAINAQSKNALIDAFGDDTANWKDKVVTVNIEKTIIAGKRGIAAYLIPDGMVLKESDDGFVYIGHIDSDGGNIRGTVERNANGTLKPTKKEELSPWHQQNENVQQNISNENEINPDDIPF